MLLGTTSRQRDCAGLLSWALDRSNDSDARLSKYFTVDEMRKHVATVATVAAGAYDADMHMSPTAASCSVWQI